MERGKGEEVEDRRGVGGGKDGPLAWLFIPLLASSAATAEEEEEKEE